MNEFILKIDDSFTKRNMEFIFALQLSRFYNRLTANYRYYLKIINSEKYSEIRDKIELIFDHGAIVYEAMYTIFNKSSFLMKTPAWNKNIEKINIIKNEFKDQKSFTNKYLKYVRNKISFHYDSNIILDTIDSFEFKKEQLFGKAETTSKIDLSFELVDEILINSLLIKINEKDDLIDRWGYFQEKLLEISNSLQDLLQFLIVDLLGEKLYLQEL